MNETIYKLDGGEWIKISGNVVTTKVTGDRAFKTAIDGLTALLLSQAGAGIPMDTPEMHKAVTEAVEAIANNV